MFNTYQAYMRQKLNDVRIDLHLARREDFHFACKLVRGAYMEPERKRAALVGYPDPIHATIEVNKFKLNPTFVNLFHCRTLAKCITMSSVKYSMNGRFGRLRCVCLCLILGFTRFR